MPWWLLRRFTVRVTKRVNSRRYRAGAWGRVVAVLGVSGAVYTVEIVAGCSGNVGLGKLMEKIVCM